MSNEVLISYSFDAVNCKLNTERDYMYLTEVTISPSILDQPLIQIYTVFYYTGKYNGILKTSTYLSF